MRKRFRVLFYSLLLVLAFLLTSCGLQNEASKEMVAFPEGQRLRLTVTPGNHNGDIIIDKGTYLERVGYNGVEMLFIDINGQNMELSEAMGQNLITTDELSAFSQIDAKNGFCSMEYDSRNGFSRYKYQYSDFTLYSTYDVFETPNDEKYHNQRLVIDSADHHRLQDTIGFPIVIEEGKIKNLAQEDWGVTFEVFESKFSHLTLNCTQLGGQHIGQLYAGGFYTLFQRTESGSENNFFTTTNIRTGTHIENNGETIITFNWEADRGKLPAGDYSLAFDVVDIYDEIPPLMRNYTDQQTYRVEFTVTEE